MARTICKHYESVTPEQGFCYRYAPRPDTTTLSKPGAVYMQKVYVESEFCKKCGDHEGRSAK